MVLVYIEVILNLENDRYGSKRGFILEYYEDTKNC